jgi:energy-coupling factor transport system permease protein
MLKDITLGQYYPADSLIHRLDPRVKLLSTILYIISLFVFRGVGGWILVTAFLILIIMLSKVPFSFMLKGVRAIWVLIVLTACCNLFFAQGEDMLVSWKFIHISTLGVHNAIYFTIRLIFLVVGTSVMTLTTTPNKLTDGMEEGLKPLSKMGIPVHEIAMMMSIALRFIPLLAEEADKIKKAQMARGANFDEGNLIQKAKGLIPILVPLFVSAFRRANDLALAMEARCYTGGTGRTKMKPLKYKSADYKAYGFVIAYMVLIIFLRVFAGDFSLL